MLMAIIAIASTAQSPQLFKFQCVVRDNSGEVLDNQSVSFRIGIHDETAGGTIVYKETHISSTNEFGLANLEIGNGAPVFGTFAGIDWRSGDKFIEIEIDPTGSTNYISIGTSQLLSVPFALHSETSDNAFWEKTGNNIYYSAGNVGINNETPQARLDVKTSSYNAQLANNNQAIYGQHYISGSYGSIGGQNVGLSGYSLNGYGLQATSQDGYAVYGASSGTGYAGYFEGKGYFSGNLGLGVIDPLTKLHIDGTVTATSFIGDGSGLANLSGDNLGNHSAVQNINLNNYWLSGDGGNEGIYVKFDGKVGIGTNSPGDAILDIHGNIDMNVNAEQGMTIRMREGDEHRWTFLYRPWVNSTLTILDEVGNKNLMVFEPITGCIGVNNTNPEVPLHIAGGSNATLDEGGYFVNGYTNTKNIAIDNDEIMARNNLGISDLWLNRFGGNVGIGLFAENLLDIRGFGTANGGVSGYNEVVAHFKNTSSGHSAISVDALAGSDAVLYLSENGAPLWSVRTDISDITGSTNNALEIRNQKDGLNEVALKIEHSIGTLNDYYIIPNGSIVPTTAGEFECGSIFNFWEAVNSTFFIVQVLNESIKNTSQLEYGLKEVLQLNPLTYTDENKINKDKTIALNPEEVVTIIPEVIVKPEKTGNSWGIKYDELIPVLINAIQEQQEQIEVLETQLKDLRPQ